MSTPTTPTTPSSSPSPSPSPPLTTLPTSTPPTSAPSRPPSPHLPTAPLSHQLSTTLPSLNRALLRAYDLALAYAEVGSPQWQTMTREAAALREEIQHDYPDCDYRNHGGQRYFTAVGACEGQEREMEMEMEGERKGSFGHDWESGYPNFRGNDPPVLARTGTEKKERIEKKGTKRGVELAEVDEGDVEGRKAGGKRARRMSEKAREGTAGVGTERGGGGEEAGEIDLKQG